MERLSVILLTKNRRRLLDRGLCALLPQLGAGDEVIIVDTGSTDGTAAMLDAMDDSRVRRLSYAGPGAWAEARMHGVGAARGGLVAFTDDDCVPAADWVETGRRALRDRDAVGGRVTPRRDDLFPDWWDERYGWLIGLSVPGQSEPGMSGWFPPYTSNLWIRAEIIRAEPLRGSGVGFETYDREDSDLWHRLRVGGYRTAFEPELIVAHEIDPARLRKDYLMKRARADGLAAGRRGTFLPPAEDVACGWWAHRFAWRPPGPVGDAEDRNPALHHELMRVRAAAALEAMIPSRAGRMILLVRAGVRFARDRSRTAARSMILMAYPPPRSVPARRNIHRVVIPAFGYLGDLILLRAVLQSTARLSPDMAFHIVGRGDHAMLFEDLCAVRWHTPADHDDPGQAVMRVVAEVRPDVILAPWLHPPGGPSLMKRLRGGGGTAAGGGGGTKPPPLVSFDRDEGLTRELDRAWIALRVPKDLHRHETENLAALFRAVGIKAEPEPVRLPPNAVEAATAANAAAAGPMILINPHSGRREKEWPAERWGELLEALLDRTRYGLAVNMSRLDVPLIESVHNRCGASGRVRVLDRIPLRALITTLAGCAGVITVDAGPQHLARALGVPSLTLYGPMDERRWGDPLRRPMHATVRGCAHDLTPDEMRGLPSDHPMRMLGTDAVLGAFEAWRHSAEESDSKGE